MRGRANVKNEITHSHTHTNTHTEWNAKQQNENNVFMIHEFMIIIRYIKRHILLLKCTAFKNRIVRFVICFFFLLLLLFEFLWFFNFLSFFFFLVNFDVNNKLFNMWLNKMSIPFGSVKRAWLIRYGRISTAKWVWKMRKSKPQQLLRLFIFNQHLFCPIRTVHNTPNGGGVLYEFIPHFSHCNWLFSKSF